jgi:hypothetical protein
VSDKKMKNKAIKLFGIGIVVLFVIAVFIPATEAVQQTAPTSKPAMQPVKKVIKVQLLDINKYGELWACILVFIDNTIGFANIWFDYPNPVV